MFINPHPTTLMKSNKMITPKATLTGGFWLFIHVGFLQLLINENYHLPGGKINNPRFFQAKIFLETENRISGNLTIYTVGNNRRNLEYISADVAQIPLH